MKFEGFILIGGKSSRMGKDKFALTLNDKTFLEIIYETLQNAGIEKVSIVVNKSETAAVADGISIIKDIYPNRGALSGIHSALTNSKSDFSMILACDYPFVSIELIDFLINLAKKEKDFDAFAPIQSDGKIQSLCAIYKTEICQQILSEMLEKTDENYSVRDFLNQIKTRYIEFSEIKNLPNSENFFFNINTPEDFVLATKLHEKNTKKTFIDILKMNVDDITEILKIQQESNLSYWSYEAYKNEISRNDSFPIVAKLNNQIIGFLIARVITAESCAELYNIGVDLNFRRKKVGARLLESLIKYCVENNLEKIFLEVRESNETAIQFYLRNNFAVIGKRKNFYSNPTEDAILMVREFQAKEFILATKYHEKNTKKR